MEACATHHFKFNYAEIKDLPPEQFVSSPVFHALGHDWVIDFYPHGSWLNMLDVYTCFLIRVQGDYKDSYATFSFSLMRKEATETAVLVELPKTDRMVFQLVGKKYPFHAQVFACCPVRRSRLNDCVNNGCFELICSIDKRGSLWVPKSFKLQSQIGKLLESSETTDVTFVVENQSFRCHRSILAARSPVLKAALFGNMVEATQKHVTIEDMCPEVFKAMLHFMYTDSLSCCDSETVSAEMAQHLFVAADRYAIEGLKASCEDRLCNSISLDTIASTLALAQRHNSPCLKTSCLEFLSEPRTLISWTLTEDYVDLMRNFPSIMAEIRGKVNNVPTFKDLKMPEK